VKTPSNNHREWNTFASRYNELKQKLSTPEDPARVADETEQILREATSTAESLGNVSHAILGLNTRSPEALILAEIISSTPELSFGELDMFDMLLHDLILDGQLKEQEALAVDAIGRMTGYGPEARRYALTIVACLLAGGASAKVKEKAVEFLLMTDPEEHCRAPFIKTLESCEDPDLKKYGRIWLRDNSGSLEETRGVL
jgi:hypothetical protein